MPKYGLGMSLTDADLPLGQSGLDVASYLGGNADLTWTANRAYYTKFQVYETGVFDRVQVYVGTQNGNIDVGVYTNVAGAPSVKLVSSGSTAAPAATGGTITVTATTLAPGQYWFAVASDSSSLTLGNNVRPGWMNGGGYRATSFPLPDPAGGALTAAGNAIMFRLFKS